MFAAAQHCGQREMIAVGEGDDEINIGVIFQSRSAPPILSFLCCIVNIFLMNKTTAGLSFVWNLGRVILPSWLA